MYGRFDLIVKPKELTEMATSLRISHNFRPRQNTYSCQTG